MSGPPPGRRALPLHAGKPPGARYTIVFAFGRIVYVIYFDIVDVAELSRISIAICARSFPSHMYAYWYTLEHRRPRSWYKCIHII